MCVCVCVCVGVCMCSAPQSENSLVRVTEHLVCQVWWHLFVKWSEMPTAPVSLWLQIMPTEHSFKFVRKTRGSYLSLSFCQRKYGTLCSCCF